MNRIKISFLLGSVFLACSMNARADIEINETTFPDENFRNWILKQPYGQDGVLTDEEIMGVKEIIVRVKRINNLKGIEFFTELTNLACTGNNLTELDISGFSMLSVLDCSWNTLTTLDISRNTTLKNLSCQGNQLTELNLSNNTELEELGCNYNKLTVLDLSKNIALTSVACMGNQLTELDVAQCTALKRLACGENQLTTINVRGCVSLESLWCNNNNLSELDVSGCSELEDIGCFSNRIRGEAMDELVERLPVTRSGKGHLPIISIEDEQNVMTRSQVAAAREKGWRPRYKYGTFDTWGWTDYEGSDDPVTFTAGQMATIILPTEPDAGKGKYYRLDRCEGNEIVFEQELQPRAHVPYIIVPFEDFSIDPGTLDLAGLKPDTVSVGSISFIGTYVRTELPALTGGDGEWRPFPPSLGGDGGGFYRIIDTTPDCSPLPAEGQGERLAFVGTLRAYLTWDDPYGPGATKGPEEEMKIVLHDRGTGSLSPAPSPEGEGRKDAAIYDLSGKMVNGKWLNGKSPRGIYIKDRKKWVTK